jgi:hypothetical protein
MANGMVNDADTSRNLTASLCDEASALVTGGALGSKVRQLRARVDEPVRLAMLGPTGAGTSTLVNALIGARVATTAPGGASRYPTWFRFADTASVTLVSRDESTTSLTFDRNDGLRFDVGDVDPASIQRIEVGWPSAILQRLTIIDTVDLDRTTIDADAHIVVLPDPATGQHALSRLGSGTTPSPVTTITVVTRADDVGNAAADAMRQAETLAAPRGALAVCGLMAEAAITLTPSDVDTLRAVANLGASTTAQVLLTADRFVTTELGIDAMQRSALLGRLGLFGTRRCIELLQQQPSLAAADLRGHLRAWSNIATLTTRIEQLVVSRSSALRSASVVNGVRRVAHELATVDERRANELERAVGRVTASMPELDQLRILHLAATQQLPISDGDVADLQLLWTSAPVSDRLGLPASTSPSTLRAMVLAAIGRWRERGDDMFASPELRDACDTVVRSYEGIFQELDGSTV